MNENIKDLWRGNIAPQEDRMLSTPEMKQIMGFIARHREAVCQGMTEEQMDAFEKLDDCLMEYNCLVQEAKAGTNYRHNYLFSEMDVLVCGDCGSKMVGKTDDR